MNRELLPADRNELFRAVQKVGLDPAEFLWEKAEYSSGSFSVLRYKQDRRCFFRFGSPTDSVNWYPAKGGMRDQSASVINVPQMISIATNHWLPELARHFSEPDLWTNLDSSNSLLRAATRSNRSPFDAHERKQIIEAIGQFEARLVKEFGQLEMITGQLQSLRDALPVLSRKDWYTFAVGALVGLGCELHATPIRDFLDWLAQSLVDAAPKLFI